MTPSLQKTTLTTAWILVVACASAHGTRIFAAQESKKVGGAATPREFGVMANSDDMRRRPPAELASMMKAIGYTSVAVSCKPERFDAAMKAYRDAGIRVGAVYVGWTTDGKSASCNIPLEKVFKRFRRTGAVVMLHTHVAKGANVSDQRIVAQLSSLARQAEEAGVTVALYPHVGNRLSTLEHAARVAEAVDHSSLGVCFNLCHYLKQHDARDLPSALRAARRRIKLITINGADVGDTRSMGWNRLIRPIDEGEFDLEGLLKLICGELEYDGSIFVQCYRLKAPARTILQDTFDRWQTLKKHCSKRGDLVPGDAHK